MHTQESEDFNMEETCLSTFSLFMQFSDLYRFNVFHYWHFCNTRVQKDSVFYTPFDLSELQKMCFIEARLAKFEIHLTPFPLNEYSLWTSGDSWAPVCIFIPGPWNSYVTLSYLRHLTGVSESECKVCLQFAGGKPQFCSRSPNSPDGDRWKPQSPTIYLSSMSMARTASLELVQIQDLE